MVEMLDVLLVDLWVDLEVVSLVVMKVVLSALQMDGNEVVWMAVL